MSKFPFKFIVQKPIHQAIRPLRAQTVAIITEAPQFYAVYELERNLGDPEKLRLLKAELKMEMISAIMDGKWEVQLE